MVYKFDLREIWSKNPKIKERADNKLANRMQVYQNFVEVLERSVESKRTCRVKFKDRVYKFENVPIDVVYIVLVDYWQARACNVAGTEDSGPSGLELIKDFIEVIWKLELVVRRYWQDVVGVSEHVNGFLDVAPEEMVHDKVEHEIHLGSFLTDYRNGFVELKMFINRIVEFFCE